MDGVPEIANNQIYNTNDLIAKSRIVEKEQKSQLSNFCTNENRGVNPLYAEQSETE